VTAPRVRRRPRLALLPLALLLLLVAEVVAIVAVGRWLGALPTVGLLLLGSLLGAWLLRREGTRAWRAFRVAVERGRPPHREVLDGMLVLLGGLLVLFPGFVSDLLGVLCLLPPTRRVLRGALGAYAARRGAVRVVRVRSRRGPPVEPSDADGSGAPGGPGGPGTTATPPPLDPPGRGTVIEGEVDERPDPRL